MIDFSNNKIILIPPSILKKCILISLNQNLLNFISISFISSSAYF